MSGPFILLSHEGLGEGAASLSALPRTVLYFSFGEGRKRKAAAILFACVGPNLSSSGPGPKLGLSSP